MKHDKDGDGIAACTPKALGSRELDEMEYLYYCKYLDSQRLPITSGLNVRRLYLQDGCIEWANR